MARATSPSLPIPGSPARTVTYTYDSADRLATVTDWAARVTHFRYDAATSQLSRIELPNGTQRVFTYDSAGRVANVRDEVVAGGALVSQFTLGYDALDRIVEETTLPEPAPFTVTAASMTYDDDDRLTAWNALATASDADGNLTRGPLGGALASFAYDARNRLTNVGTTSYTYDAEGRRISRTASGTKTTFVHDPNAALSRLLQSTTGSTTTRYVYAGSLLLYAETGSALRVHHYDYRGSTDATGAVLGRVTYGSYGEIVARTGNTATEFLYNGRDGVVTDPNGLYHMRARYYSPETRRFLNADPIGFAAGTNWFAYVGGSPVMCVDPRGLDAYIFYDSSTYGHVGIGVDRKNGVNRYDGAPDSSLCLMVSGPAVGSLRDSVSSKDTHVLVIPNHVMADGRQSDNVIAMNLGILKGASGEHIGWCSTMVAKTLLSIGVVANPFGLPATTYYEARLQVDGYELDVEQLRTTGRKVPLKKGCKK